MIDEKDEQFYTLWQLYTLYNTRLFADNMTKQSKETRYTKSRLETHRVH